MVSGPSGRVGNCDAALEPSAQGREHHLLHRHGRRRPRTALPGEVEVRRLVDEHHAVAAVEGGPYGQRRVLLRVLAGEVGEDGRRVERVARLGEVAGPDGPHGAVVGRELVDGGRAVLGRRPEPEPGVPQLDPGVVDDGSPAVGPRRPVVRGDDEPPWQLDRGFGGARGVGERRGGEERADPDEPVHVDQLADPDGGDGLEGAVEPEPPLQVDRRAVDPGEGDGVGSEKVGVGDPDPRRACCGGDGEGGQVELAAGDQVAPRPEDERRRRGRAAWGATASSRVAMAWRMPSTVYSICWSVTRNTSRELAAREEKTGGTSRGRSLPAGGIRVLLAGRVGLARRDALGRLEEGPLDHVLGRERHHQERRSGLDVAHECRRLSRPARGPTPG